MQRKLEREIRQLKREASAFNAATDSADDETLKNELKSDFTRTALELKRKESALKKFLEETNQQRQKEREQVSGFNRSVAQKAVWAERKNARGLTPSSDNVIMKVIKKAKDIFIPDKFKPVSEEFLDSLPKLSSPESMQQAIKAVNPSNDRYNCQRCVPVYELRRRGYDVVAVPASEYDTLGLSDFRKIFVNAKWIYCDGNGKEEIKEFLLNSGHGTRVEISFISVKGAHVFCAENINGKVTFVDPQKKCIDIEQYFEIQILENTSFCRIDNLEISNLIKLCIDGADKYEGNNI